jgi:hypothetical protein
MSQHVRLWEVSREGLPRDLPLSRVELESRLEDWIEHDISMVGADLLVIGKQVPTDFGGWIDLLCIDSSGHVVVVELKRDRTPREVTAQTLDYGSWVTGLKNDQITEIANEYLKATGPLDAAFTARFKTELPETLNQKHKLLIVAASIDASSERIIRYLSEVHAVNINAVTFQVFGHSDGSQYLARVFLTDPSQVEKRSREQQGSTRKPRLTVEELHALAEEQNLGDEFGEIYESLRQCFDAVRTTRSTLNFVRYQDGSRQAVINLVPAESVASRGVRFQVYARRLAGIAGISVEELRTKLPPDAEEWSFFGDDPEWSGYAGYWTPPDVEAFCNTVLRRKVEA